MRSSDRIEWDLKNEMFQFKTKCHQRGSYCNIGFSLNECQPFIKQVNLKFLLTSFVTLKNYFTSSFYVSLTWEDSINLAIIICNLSTGLKVFWYLLFPRVPPLYDPFGRIDKRFLSLISSAELSHDLTPKLNSHNTSFVRKSGIAYFHKIML